MAHMLSQTFLLAATLQSCHSFHVAVPSSRACQFEHWAAKGFGDAVGGGGGFGATNKGPSSSKKKKKPSLADELEDRVPPKKEPSLGKTGFLKSSPRRQS